MISPFTGLNLSNKANKSDKSRWIKYEKVEMQLTSDSDISMTL